MLRAGLPLLLLLSVWLPAPVPAAEGIRRCEGPDGVTIYTDRPCGDLGAVDRKVDLEPAIRTAPPGTLPGAAPSPLLRTDCARSTDTLLFDLRRHVESRNVNRVAGLYHWVGVGSGSARHVMDRLQRLVDDPPSAIEFVYPPVAPVHDDPAAFPAGTPIEDPVGLRFVRGELGVEPPIDLRLVRHAECWWFSYW